MAKIRWNLPAFEEIRRLPGVGVVVGHEVERVLDRVGRDNYAGGVEPGRTRTRGYVVTMNLDGIIDNSRNHSLLRAIGGGEAS